MTTPVFTYHKNSSQEALRAKYQLHLESARTLLHELEKQNKEGKIAEPVAKGDSSQLIFHVVRKSCIGRPK